MITVLLLWGLLSVAVTVAWARAGRRVPACERVPVRLPETALLERR